jgi:polysaccharide biosynthesis protein PslH
MKRETIALTRPPLVVVAPWVYHLRCGMGGGVLCFRMLKDLSAHYAIHWISFDVTVNDVEAGKAALREFCASVTTVAVPPRTARWRLRSRQLLGGAPVAAQVMSSPEMAATIGKVVRQTGAVAALFQFPPVAQYLDAAGAVPTIMDTQDVCMVSMFRKWRKASGFVRRLIDASTWYAWTRYEMRHYAKADLMLALSDTDAGVLRAFLPDVPCAVSPVASEVSSRAQRDAGSYVAMVGNFHHPPNVDGLRWLIDEVWPQVRARAPIAELHVAGPQCPAATQVMEARGIRMLGFVDDVDAFFDGAALSVCPYRFGGGVKIKVLEALARGCPVVTTALGTEGLSVSDGVHLAVANDSQAFAEAIVKLLNDPALASRFGEAGRAHIQTGFSFHNKTMHLKGAIEQLVQVGCRRTPTGTAPKAQALL